MRSDGLERRRYFWRGTKVRTHSPPSSLSTFPKKDTDIPPPSFQRRLLLHGRHPPLHQRPPRILPRQHLPFCRLLRLRRILVRIRRNPNPVLQRYGAYSPSNPAAGLTEPSFEASLAFWLLFMGLFCFLSMILSLRTNGIFLGVFTLLVPSFSLLVGSFWNSAQGNATAALSCQKASFPMSDDPEGPFSIVGRWRCGDGCRG